MVSLSKPKAVPAPPAHGPRYTVNPTAFVAALLLAPILVTLLTFWAVIGLFALFLGAAPYLVIGTPVLIWAVGRIKPDFYDYALLGLLGNIAAGLVCIGLLAPSEGFAAAVTFAGYFFGFGLVFAPLYAGTFGVLYARFHPDIRPLAA